ncbi:hypothetical protein [Streptomyces cyanogenus]|uniref:Uncharacterized protein n=1 Tax=Streptomyces cyanogenus TaxID=80860 RepID=A0ABX7TXK8_STRCY|nr:hypothetical protein [Streptomyces cyanogenus]QTE01510.1 hypothetical protein S1361_29550 [Streptomyces cyanogenus]
MTAAELQSTFGLSANSWEQITSSPDMPRPMDPKYTDGVTKWAGQYFARWLARQHPLLAGRVPSLLHPAPATKPCYLDGRYATSDEAGWDREHFAGLWETCTGVVAVIYPRSRIGAPRDLLEFHENAATVVTVQPDYDLYGPSLEAVDRALPDLQYEPRWSEVAAHVGTQVPWWPSQLRRPEHLTSWRPGDDPVPVDVVTWPSWEPLYELAGAEPEGSPVRGACFTIGHEMRTKAAEWIEHEVTEILDTRGDFGRGKSPKAAAERAAMVLPAVPSTEDPGRSETVSADVVALGLAELCRRTDDHSVECLEQISMWSREHLPFGGVFSITRTDVSREGAEWINRLRRVSPTAIHRLWTVNGDDPVGTFVDPVTGSPVVAFKGRFMFRDSREISYLGSAPKRLPAGSVLKEVILDEPVWVRTTDDILYPAPSLDAPGLSWGYSGSGPGTLAQCVGRLLDDGSAHAVTYGDRQDEPGLEAFFQIKHERGTRIPRQRLEALRTSS